MLAASFLSLLLLPLAAQAISPAMRAELLARRAAGEEVEFFEHTPSQIRQLQALVDAQGPNGAFHQELSKRGAQITGLQTKCTSSHCLAITFDDGPYIYHQNISNQFSNAGAKTSFMVNGNNYGCIYDLANVQSIRRSLAQGHQIASHTWSHPHLLTLSYAQVDQQVLLNEQALLKVAGIVPAFIRPPYGETNDTLTKYLNDKHGLIVLNWGYDTQDADGATVDYSLNVIKGLKAPTHAVVLQHETVPTTSSKLVPQEIPILEKNGYTPQNFQTVAAAFAANPYKVKTNFQNRDSSWTCAGTPQPGQ